jgi:hypothetical protein
MHILILARITRKIDVGEIGKWLISWTSESFTTEHTENIEYFSFIFLRELCDLCGEKLVSPLFYLLSEFDETAPVCLLVVLLFAKGLTKSGVLNKI